MIGTSARGFTIAIGSGKGGVGKTTVSANLALALARQGLRVTLLDGDMGLANVDVMLGLVPEMTIEHFFTDGVPLEELAVEGPLGIRVIPAGSGLPEMSRLAPADLAALDQGLEPLRRSSDIVLMDTPAGIGDVAARLWLMADRVLLVTWPEPTALVDAYAALKVLRRGSQQPAAALVVNGASGREEAELVHRRLDVAARQFLGEGLPLDGFVVRDEAVTEAARRQRAVLLADPLSQASRSIERLALNVAALAAGRTRGSIGQTWARNCTPAELLH